MTERVWKRERRIETDEAVTIDKDQRLGVVDEAEGCNGEITRLETDEAVMGRGTLPEPLEKTIDR